MSLTSIHNSMVIVRVDFNLPSLDETFRIEALLPTIKLLLSQENKVVILTHWGRPDENNRKELSVKNMQPMVEKLLGQPVHFINQFDGFEEAEEIIVDAAEHVFLLENTRFNEDEQSKNAGLRRNLAEKYATLGQFFVDEAFSVSHRAEATNAEIKEFLPHTYGLRHAEEREVLGTLKTNPTHPFSVILGGAKGETKLPMIQKLIDHTDTFLLGGLLAFTFLKAAKNLNLPNIPEIYDSFVEEEFLPTATELLKKYPGKIVLPVDIVLNEVEGKKRGCDVGPKTTELFEQILKNSKTVLWNGPLGWVEQKPFDASTNQIVLFLSKLDTAYTVIGGGDTAAIIPLELEKNFSFISTGGGATLEFLGNE